MAIACLSADGTPLAITAGDSVQAWDLRFLPPRRRPVDTAVQRIRSLAATGLQDGSFVVAAVADGKLWRLRSGTFDEQLISEAVGPSSAVTCVRIDGDPIALVTGPDVKPRTWNLRTGLRQAITASEDIGEYETAVCAYRAGSPVAVMAGPSDLRVWDLATGRSHVIAAGRLDMETNSVACSRLDGITVATTTHKDCLRIWDLDDLKLLEQVALPNPLNATVTPQGDLAVIFSHGASVFQRKPFPVSR
jgi:WD40 repeat protein